MASSKQEFFNNLNNDPHMLAAIEAVKQVVNAGSVQELQLAEYELNGAINSALSGSTPRQCLTTISSTIANWIGTLRLKSQGDSLLEQRISVLSKSFNYLDNSY